MKERLSILVLIVLVNVTLVNSTQPKENKPNKPDEIHTPKNHIPKIIINIDAGTKGKNSSENNQTVVTHISKHQDEVNSNSVIVPSEATTLNESSAVIKGILIFVSISMVFFIYLGCRTYRRKKVNVHVRKYGVRTRRSDVEMRPLPLDDDEEDETVFDVGNLNKT